MLDTTYTQAVSLKTTLDYLNAIKAELSNADTQTVIRLKKRPLPAAPPAALTDSLAAMESFLLAQAVTEVQSQIDSLQAQFTALQDPA
jgi:hypothetical protein